MKKYSDLIKVKEKEKKDLPKVEILEQIIAHDVNAHQIAKTTYGKDYNNMQFVLCKLSLCCRFNGGIWNIKQVEELPREFINAIVEAVNTANEEGEEKN